MPPVEKTPPQNPATPTIIDCKEKIIKKIIGGSFFSTDHSAAKVSETSLVSVILFGASYILCLSYFILVSVIVFSVISYTFWSHIKFLGLQEALLLLVLSRHLFKAIKTRFPGIFSTLPEKTGSSSPPKLS